MKKKKKPDKKTTRKYYLHRSSKNVAKIDRKAKTIFCSFDAQLANKHIIALQNEFNYQVQMEIPD